MAIKTKTRTSVIVIIALATLSIASVGAMLFNRLTRPSTSTSSTSQESYSVASCLPSSQSPTAFSQSIISDPANDVADDHMDIVEAKVRQFEKNFIQFEIALRETNAIPLLNQSYLIFLDTNPATTDGYDYQLQINLTSGSYSNNTWTLWLSDSKNKEISYRVATPVFKRADGKLAIAAVIPTEYIGKPATFKWYAKSQGTGSDMVNSGNFSLYYTKTEPNTFSFGSSVPYLVNNKTIGLVNSAATINVKNASCNYAFNGTTNYFSTNLQISVNASGTVGVTRLGETALIWARLNNDYIIPTPLTVIYRNQYWTGRRAAYGLPKLTILGASMDLLLKKYDVISKSDLGSDLMVKWIGNVEPQGSSLIWLDMLNNMPEQSNILASPNVANVAVPFPMISDSFNSLGYFPYTYIFHEYGHHFCGISKRYEQLFKDIGPFIESFPTNMAFLAVNKLYSSETNSIIKNYLLHNFNGAKSNIMFHYDPWIKAGAPIIWIKNQGSSQYDANSIFNGIMFVLADQYGWDKFEKFMTLLLSPNQRISDFDSGSLANLFLNNRFEASSTVVAAAWSVVSGSDQFNRFANTWHFPLNSSNYDQIKQGLYKLYDTTKPNITLYPQVSSPTVCNCTAWCNGGANPWYLTTSKSQSFSKSASPAYGVTWGGADSVGIKDYKVKYNGTAAGTISIPHVNATCGNYCPTTTATSGSAYFFPQKTLNVGTYSISFCLQDVGLNETCTSYFPITVTN